ncbi:MAG: S41 family peptidase [Anaerolineaceae bacterium]|jgi:carboxyl-terminal processing protease
MLKSYTRYALFFVAAALLLAGAFSGGMIVGWAMPDRSIQEVVTPSQVPLPQAATSEPAAEVLEEPVDRDELFIPFWEVWDILHESYVDQPLDHQALMRGAIQGMLSSLGDPHTTYMDPDEFRRASAPLEGEYEGIGAYVDITGEYLKIISPMPDSPAEQAGLKPDDIIIAVDGDDMTGVDGNLVLRRILGPAGTTVTLTIQREGEIAPFDVTITRARILLPSADGEMLADGIAYVRVYMYGEKTMNELQQALRTLMAQQPVGLILDLRNNAGGYLPTAIEVTSQFMEADQVVMYEEFGDGTREVLKSKSGGLAVDIPMVVLVNNGSASAAEITAGALQDTGRAVLVGTTTFGKGSVQRWAPLSNDQGAVRVTIARWLTPDGRQIHQVGLEPDYLVELTEEDAQAERDPQLDKAIELLKR